ncbi:hypothetical protein BH24ACT8_BH24ACT8_16520 [soil metagenome]
MTAYIFSPETALWLLFVLPAVVGALLCLGRARFDLLAAPVSLVTAATGLLLAVAVAATRPALSVPFVAGTPFALGVDTLSAVVVVTVAAVTLLVLVFATGDGTESPARFHGLMLLFFAAVVVTSTATTLPTLLVAWEVMGATSYALIGFAWQDQGKTRSGATAFLTTRAGDLGLYAAAGAALAGGAGLALADLPEASAGWLHVVAAGVLVAALGKAAQLPFSFWLSGAMQGPSPVSALLHSAAMVAMGGYLLLRVHDLLAVTGWADVAAAWVGALTALSLGAVALAQRDLKQLLAASTCAQLGFVVLSAGLGAVAGGTAHLVAHAATKALLFLVAGAWLSALGTKQLSALRGAARRWPLVGVTAAAGLFALAGVAPLSLWATKDEVLAVALRESPALYVVGLAAAALSAAYAGKVLVVVWRGPVGDVEAGYDDEGAGTRRVSRLEVAPLVPLAAGATALGVLALPPVGDALRRALGEASTPTAGPLELIGSALIALAVLGAVLRWPPPAPQWAAGWLGLEPAVHLLVVDPTCRLARAFARFDDRVLDRAVEQGALVTVALARRLGRIDVRGVDGAVESLARSTRRLGDLVRRSQTGQLHEYYVQTAALLAAGVVLLVLLG